jgi:hypothetical protein
MSDGVPSPLDAVPDLTGSARRPPERAGDASYQVDAAGPLYDQLWLN